MKDRAAPFSRKHRRYWITVTGGMILICLINLAIGIYFYYSSGTSDPTPPEPIRPILPGRDAAPAQR